MMRKKVGNEEYHGSNSAGRRSSSSSSSSAAEREEGMHRKAAALAWYRHGRKGTTFLGSGRGSGNLSKMKNPLLQAPRSHHGSSDQYYSSCGPYAAMEKERTYTETTDMGGGLQVAAPDQSVNPYTLSLTQQPNLSPHLPQQASLSPTLQAHLSPNHQAHLSPFHQQASLSPTLQATLSPLHQSPTIHQASRFKAEALALKSSSSSSSISSSTSPSSATSSNKQQMMNMSTGQSLALLSLLPHQQSQKCFNLSQTEYAGNCSSSSSSNNNNTTPWDCGSSLYDSFELLCLSNQLGRCLTTVNAAAMAGSSSTAATSISSSSCKKVLKNLATPLQGPSLQPVYIPRSLYALPQFMIPSYLATKSAKKRSSLIHPIFSSSNIPTTINISTASSSSSSLPAPTEDHAARKKAESGGGFRRVFNSLLKSLHMKEDSGHQKPKRSNLSEELEKLPKNRPSSSRGALLYQNGPAAADMAASKRSPATSSQYRYHHHFRNEGFRTTYKPPKSVKWVQPGAST